MGLRGCLKSHNWCINVFLPHPNPPLVKGRELDFPVSPLSKGGLRGVKIRLKSQPTTFQTTSKERRRKASTQSTQLDRGVTKFEVLQNDF